MTRALADLLTTLEGEIAKAPPAEVPVLVGHLEQLKAVLWARLTTAQASDTEQDQSPEESNRLLTIPQAAQILAVPKGYAYELARRGGIPTVRFGKYVRVRLTDLWEWVARHQEKGLDLALCVTHTSSRERLRGSTASQAPATHPSPTGQSARRHRQQRGPVGARRARHPGDSRPATSATSEDGTEGQV